jgi:hypothetical protein
MKALYLESSALLAWLLGESSAAEVKVKIDEADTVVTSVLTILEAERALIRAESASLLSAGDAEKLKGLLAQSSAGWALMEISEDVRHRAARYFPAEPLRTWMQFTSPPRSFLCASFPHWKCCPTTSESSETPSPSESERQEPHEIFTWLQKMWAKEKHGKTRCEIARMHNGWRHFAWIRY